MQRLVVLLRPSLQRLPLVMIVMLILLFRLLMKQFKVIALERIPLLEHGRLPMLVEMLPLLLVNPLP